ncbi:MAG: RNA polymerase sigma factor RpoH [Gammaproteobacteria bacterium]|nr:RNA polymerase sigma factor RpoH [Gammaproteobacteria bacterium]
MSTALATSFKQLPTLTSTGSLEAYIQSVYKIPVLTKEEEYEYATSFRENEDAISAQRLILPHLRFVIKIANNYNGYGLAIADLIQEGNIGLMKAVKRFDPEVGVRLVSFAVHWIKAEIHEFIIKNWKIVKVATTKAQRKLFFKLRSYKKRLGWFKKDEVEHVAEQLGVTTQNVLEMENRLNRVDSAFDLGSDDNDDEIAYNSPSLTIQTETPSPEVALIEHDSSKKNITQLTTALDALDDRSKDIVYKRWLNDSKETLHQLADQYNVSAERIRQIEKNAFNKMKQNIIIA